MVGAGKKIVNYGDEMKIELAKKTHSNKTRRALIMAIK